VVEWKAAAQSTKLLIGDHAGMAWREGSEDRSITWKLAKAGRKTEWKEAAEWYQQTAQLLKSGTARELDALRRVLASWAPEAKIFGHTTQDGDVLAGFAVTALETALAVIDGMADPNAFDRFTTTKAESRRFCVPRDWPSISLD
jgi:hypothetical protein